MERGNEIYLECLNTKIVSLTCSREKDYAGDSKSILKEYLKENDCDVPAIDGDKNVEAETKKFTALVVIDYD